ncbi:helix-turn-helix domain-containing protein [Embleya sp. NBC_00888]|uniref:MmyB family transcriptional regulator n=1 Tax=Embleya sp. NBC_00888 TaxID=2975960 RepID=UPI003870380F|nr:helix-turn-helix domain-containing protein [Embleya sp. NBC_00888]
MTTLEPNAAPNPGRRELGAFLRAHRAQIRPEDVGLPAGTRRRTPGLRREEVAVLSGVGLTWYVWLEQGRVDASRQVLDALARTLGLDADGYRHLLELAGLHAGEPDETLSTDRISVLRPLLDAFAGAPTLLMDQRMDVLAWNAAYPRYWPDPAEVPVERRNLMWLTVAHPPTRAALEDWEPYARAVLAQFRERVGRRPGDARVREVLDLLRGDVPELDAWWECRGVASLTAREVGVRGSWGRARFAVRAMRPADAPEALILTFLPTTDDAAMCA